MSDTVVVEGADRAAATLRAAARSLSRLDDAHTAAGQLVAGAARSAVPNRSGRSTGALAGSVQVDAAAESVTIGSSAAHAGPINFGVGARAGLRGPHNIPPSRWLTGALDTQIAPVTARYTEHVSRIIDTVKGA